jgi:hypothetical protein
MQLVGLHAYCTCKSGVRAMTAAYSHDTLRNRGDWRGWFAMVGRMQPDQQILLPPHEAIPIRREPWWSGKWIPSISFCRRRTRRRPRAPSGAFTQNKLSRLQISSSSLVHSAPPMPSRPTFIFGAHFKYGALWVSKRGLTELIFQMETQVWKSSKYQIIPRELGFKQ